MYTDNILTFEKGSGLLEPVKVDLKVGRAGLGLEQKLRAMKQEKEERYLNRIKKLNREFDPNKFR